VSITTAATSLCLLHAGRGLRTRLRLPRAEGALEIEEIERTCGSAQVGVADFGSPAESIVRRNALETSRRAASRDPGSRSGAYNERGTFAAEGMKASRAAGLASVTVSSTVDDHTFRRERRRFPGRTACSTVSPQSRQRGVGVQGQRRRQARSERRRNRRPCERFRGNPAHAQVIEYMDVGNSNGGASTMSSLPTRTFQADRRVWPLEAIPAARPEETSQPVRLSQAGRDRRDRIGDQAVMRRGSRDEAVGRGHAPHRPLP